MGWPVVLVDSGGIPVTEAANGLGAPVTIAANGLGTPVTVVESGGAPVVGTGGGSKWRFVGQTQRIAAAATTVATNNTRHQGRIVYWVGPAPLRVRLGWMPWRFTLSNSAPIVDCPNAVPITKCRVNILASDMATVLGSAPVTASGSRSFSVPTGVTFFHADAMEPSDFGLSAFPGDCYFEIRQMSDMTVGQQYPVTTVGTGRGGLAQSRTGTPTTLPDEVDGTGLMGGSSTTFGAGFFPFITGIYDGEGPKVFYGIGDSHTERTWDFPGAVPPTASNPLGGAGWFTRAIRAINGACLNGGVAGATAFHWSIATRALEMAQFADYVTILLGTNDISGTMPNGTAGQPITVAFMKARRELIRSIVKGYGIRKCVELTLPPRVVDNNYRGTDLSQMAAVASSATVAGGASRDGYGWATGETRDIWNADLLASVGQANGPDAVYDLAAEVSDPTNPYRWKVDAWGGTTLAAAVAVNDTTLSLNGSPPAFASLILNPGVSGVDPAGTPGSGGLIALSTSGSGPYAVTLALADPYSNQPALNSGWGVPAKTQTLGATVKATRSIDGIHMTPAVQIEQAALIASVLAAA